MRQATPGSGSAAPKPVLRPAVVPSASASAAAPAPTSSVEIVPSRAGEGMKRGRYEAPAWAFWALLGVIVVISTIYLLVRLGILGRKRTSAK